MIIRGRDFMGEKRRWLRYPLGFAVGLLNGLFGAGGGMVAVPMLRGMGMKTNQSHATSLSIVLPLSILSGWLYLRGEHFSLAEAAKYLPGGLAGAIVGAIFLPKIKTIWLRRLFGAVIIFSGGRLLLG